MKIHIHGLKLLVHSLFLIKKIYCILVCSVLLNIRKIIARTDHCTSERSNNRLHCDFSKQIADVVTNR